MTEEPEREAGRHRRPVLIYAGGTVAVLIVATATFVLVSNQTVRAIVSSAIVAFAALVWGIVRKGPPTPPASKQLQPRAKHLDTSEK